MLQWSFGEPSEQERPVAVPERLLLLRREDAAERLGIARSSLYQLVMAGEVESVLVGRLRRVPVGALEDFVARLRADAAADAKKRRAKA